MGRLAVYAVDPGGISGVARGVFDLSATSVLNAMKVSGGVESWEVEGEPYEQAHEILAEWRDWYNGLRDDLDVTFVFACESFQLREGMKSGKTLLWPVEIRAMFELWLFDQGQLELLQLQTPSQMKTYATAARLKSWGVYVPGRDHRRDAAGHVALALTKRLR